MSRGALLTLCGLLLATALIVFVLRGEPTTEVPPAEPATARPEPERTPIRSMGELAPTAIAARLRADPDELDAVRDRLEALLFDRSDAGRAERRRLILGLLECCPEDPVLGLSEGQLDPHLDPEAWKRARELWAEHLAPEDASTRVLSNAKNWFMVHERDDAFVILDRLQEREPDSARWHQQEALIHSLDLDEESIHTPEAAARAAAARDAMARALEVAGADRPRLLGDAIEAAALAGDWATAEAWARELLASEDATVRSLMKGHQGVGLALAARGDLDGAAAELLQMGTIPPGASTQSFGPSMLLARELLVAGRTEPVLAYLDAVSAYWQPETVAGWKATIEAGQVPDFGANLAY